MVEERVGNDMKGQDSGNKVDQLPNKKFLGSMENQYLCTQSEGNPVFLTLSRSSHQLRLHMVFPILLTMMQITRLNFFSITARRFAKHQVATMA